MNRAAPAPKENMGEPVPRIDGRLKVTGEALYGSDFPVRNQAYAFLVTSAISKGRIDKIDLSEARSVRGVLDILTHENTPKLATVPFSTGGGGATSSIQDLGPEIFYDGQIVGMVLADTFEAAREAAYKVKIDYTAEDPAATFGSSGIGKEDAAKASERAKSFPQAGDAEKAVAGAEVTLDAAYGTPTQHHNAMELFTTTCMWKDDELTVYEPSQFVYGLKNTLAHKLSISPEQVRVVSTFVGGAFGSKAQFSPRTGLTAYAARKLNRPVKLVATRDQGFTIQTYRAETRHHLRIGARRDGKIVGFIHEGEDVTSRPDPYMVAGVTDSARLYHYDTIKTGVSLSHADRNTPGFMRSPPVVPYIYALENAIDELAVKLQMDPIELRRVNDSMTDGTGKPWSSRHLMECYDEAAKAFGWQQREPGVGAMRDGDWLVGWGCASAVYPTHVGAAAARVRLEASGHAKVQVAAHDLGTGAYTVIGQMAAEKLSLPLSAVTVELGDTEFPPAPVAGGSNTTASVCNAVAKACDAIREKLARKATTSNSGPLAGKPPDHVRFTEGHAVAADGKQEKLEKLFHDHGIGAIEEYAEFLPNGAGPDAIKNLSKGKPTLTGGSHGDKLMYALGAEFVEVRVHTLTREVRVPRMVGAFAAGRIMNTRTARSQLMGGMIWGIASALHEETEIDRRNARYVNDNLADYLVPVNADVQDVDVILIPEKDDYVNPAGIKGIGELGNSGTAAAVASAVHHATGVRVRQLPIRLEKLLPA
jgi:xanthine dehydrogenase YagR molybdenum-binding subunit